VNTVTTPTVSTPAFLSQWRWWLPVALLSLAAVLIFIDPFIGDWDAVDYTVAALRGYPSSMALGRGLFIFYNHALFLLAHAIFGLQPAHAYLLFKYTVVAQAPLAIIACWKLTYDFSVSPRAATIAAMLLGFSPLFVVYGGQVMTDVPAILILMLALIAHFHGLQQDRLSLVLLGAALLGLGVNLRETVGFFGLWLVAAPFVAGHRPTVKELTRIALSCLIFFVFAMGGFAYWFLTDPGYRQAWHGWRVSM
jgi:4-amino-4-deoxy-L-arabinose transferase-like glycosyltransferase